MIKQFLFIFSIVAVSCSNDSQTGKIEMASPEGVIENPKLSDSDLKTNKRIFCIDFKVNNQNKLGFGHETFDGSGYSGVSGIAYNDCSSILIADDFHQNIKFLSLTDSSAHVKKVIDLSEFEMNLGEIYAYNEHCVVLDKRLNKFIVVNINTGDKKAYQLTLELSGLPCQASLINDDMCVFGHRYTTEQENYYYSIKKGLKLPLSEKEFESYSDTSLTSWSQDLLNSLKSMVDYKKYEDKVNGGAYSAKCQESKKAYFSLNTDTMIYSLIVWK